MQKKIIGFINAENEVPENVVKKADKYSCEGADSLFIYNYTGDYTEREKFFNTLREVDKRIDIPFFVGIYVERFEDAKKALYTGATSVCLRKVILPSDKELEEVLNRFDSDKVYIEIDMEHDFHDKDDINKLIDMGFGKVVCKHIDITEKMIRAINDSKAKIIIRDSLERHDIVSVMKEFDVEAIATNYYEEKNINKAKNVLNDNGIEVNMFKSSISFSDLKTDDNGLIPVIVQDYRTDEVLMLAYMNEESFNKTLETGLMNYYSRSRNELWQKGDTSGHYQYVKRIDVDCDNDTLLAHVRQIGAACHTGNRSCFYTNIAKKDYIELNPLNVLMEDFDIIKDRKNNPKEGSYTNYLFDKGIDKILKKCGEEATEIVIAAKNPDKEELKYEISDFLYHMMVLMAEKGLDWEDIARELVNRR